MQVQHAQELNSACRAVTGCLKLTNLEDLYFLARIAPPDKMYVLEWKIPNRNPMRPTLYYGQHPAERRMKSRNCFLRSVKPAEFSPKIVRCNEWLRRLQTTRHKVTVNLSESLAR